jgi:hypothetical protein
MQWEFVAPCFEYIKNQKKNKDYFPCVQPIFRQHSANIHHYSVDRANDFPYTRFSQRETLIINSRCHVWAALPAPMDIQTKETDGRTGNNSNRGGVHGR